MKAVVVDKFCQSLSELRVSEIPNAEAQDDNIVIKVAAAGVNFVDTLYARGKHQNNRSLVRPPFTMGLEYAGTVVSSPPSSPYKPGDAVFGDHPGCYIEYITLPADSASIQRVPRGWDIEAAAGLAATLPVSYGALVHSGRMTAGETVLVHAAAGGLGVMPVQIAAAMGCQVIGTAGTDEKCAYVKQYGATACINYTKENWWELVNKETDGKGVDLVFDPVGLVDRSLKCIAHRGRIVVVGFAGTEGKIETIAMNRILLKQVSLIGYRYGESLRRHPEERQQIWDALYPMLEKGLIKATVSKYYHGLASVPQALEDISQRKVIGKAVVKIGKEQSAQARL